MKQFISKLRSLFSQGDGKRGKKKDSPLAVIALPAAVLLVVFVIVLVILLKPAGKPKPSQPSVPNIAQLIAPGEYRRGSDGFDKLQSDFYDYYYPLLGFGHISFSGKDGHFSDSELIQFALIRLSYEDSIAVRDGVTALQIEKMTKRYFDDVPTKLEGYYLKNDGDKYIPQNDEFLPGALMSLQKLTVGEDGICTAEFYRSKMPDSDFILSGGQTEEDFKQSFLNGYFEGLDDVQRIRMVFHQHKTADGDVYNVIHSIEQIVS